MSTLNQLEKRTKMLGVAAAEAMSIDPMLLSLRGPRPVVAAGGTAGRYASESGARIRWQRGERTVYLDDVIGPNDAHDPDGHCYDHTFDWFPSQAEVEALIDERRLCVDTSHRIVLVHQTVTDPDPHCGKVVDGRHFVLAARVANAFAAAEGFKPGIVRFQRRAYTPAEALLLAEQLNRSRKRDVAASIRQKVAIIEAMSFTEKQAAAHFEVAESTIRNWRNRTAGRKTKTGRKRETHRITAARAEQLIKRIDELDYVRDAETVKTVIRGMVTGALPEGAPEWLQEVWGAR